MDVLIVNSELARERMEFSARSGCVARLTNAISPQLPALTPAEDGEVIATINESKANTMWVSHEI